MTKEDGVRPTQQGTHVAKDLWMVGSGMDLFIDALTPSRAKRKAVRKAIEKPGRKAAVARGAVKGYAKGVRHR
jgi:hypothetical protein